MNIQSVFEWLEQTRLATTIAESAFLFPWIESLHVLAITVMVGTIGVVDFRLLGWASRDRPASQLMAEVLPFTRIAFAAAVVTGVLLFVSRAANYVDNTPFLVKMALLVVALINIAVFHGVTLRNVRQWDAASVLPASAKAAGGISLALWVAVVAFGRWIGFV